MSRSRYRILVPDDEGFVWWIALGPDGAALASVTAASGLGSLGSVLGKVADWIGRTGARVVEVARTVTRTADLVRAAQDVGDRCVVDRDGTVWRPVSVAGALAYREATPGECPTAVSAASIPGWVSPSRPSASSPLAPMPGAPGSVSPWVLAVVGALLFAVLLRGGD